MGQHLSHIFGKKTQKLVFNGRQMQFLLLQIGAACHIVNPKLSVDKGGSTHLLSLPCRQSSLRHPKPCEKLFYREGLCQIIIRSCIQGIHFVHIFTSGTDNDDWHI